MAKTRLHLVTYTHWGREVPWEFDRMRNRRSDHRVPLKTTSCSRVRRGAGFLEFTRMVDNTNRDQYLKTYYGDLAQERGEALTVMKDSVEFEAAPGQIVSHEQELKHL